MSGFASDQFDENGRRGSAQRRVLLGRIVGVHGVRGEVKIESSTEPRLAIFDYAPWLLETAPDVIERIEKAHGRAQGKGVVASLPHVEDRDAAARLIGAKIFVPRAALPELQGEFYQDDLAGLEVVNLAGVSFGKVSHLFDTGANLVLVARREDGREHLIPYVPDVYVQAVDLAARRVTVDWDEDF
ncbi:MAG: 16S rRNA processing protein RimM [Proteobacteria bacterium]|nr:16S rRNA processing protein RimM [Pseudomonadota bacterium]